MQLSSSSVDKEVRKLALITKKQREDCENLIYAVMDQAEATKGTHMNSDYYRELFSKMSDDQFYNFFKSKRLPLRFHYEPFKVEPQLDDVIKAFKLMNKSLIEKINLPHVYTREDGTPVKSQECLVIFIHIKRMKQNVIDKSHVAMNIEQRDMKNGLLSGHDKGARESDREFESLAAFGLEYNMDEFSRARADSMRAAAEMNSVILGKGSVSDKDITVAKSDNLAKNMMNVYLLGANIHSNLIDTDYMTPYTARNKQRGYTRAEV